MILIQKFTYVRMYTFTVGHSISCTALARTSDNGDQYLNEVLAMPKTTHITEYTHIKLTV